MNIDIFCAVETWLTSDIPSKLISTDYTLIRQDRTKRKGKNGTKRAGGVFIAYKSFLKVTQVRNIIIPDLIEAVFAKFSMNSEKILIGSIYIPPPVNAEKLNQLDTILESIDKVRDQYTSVLILGDFNYNLEKNNRLSTIFQSQMLQNFIHEHTRQNSILDLCLTDTPDLIKQCKITENISTTCDHLAISVQLHIPKKKTDIF